MQKTIDQLIEVAPDDPQLLRSRAAMFNNFVDTYLAAGDLHDAATAAAQGLDILRELAAQDPGKAEAQRDVSVSLEKVGNVKQQQGDLAARLTPIRRVSTFAASWQPETLTTHSRSATCRWA